MNRPSAGYTCVICGQPVVLRIGWYEDECTGCGARFPTKHFYPDKEAYNKKKS